MASLYSHGTTGYSTDGSVSSECGDAVRFDGNGPFPPTTKQPASSLSAGLGTPQSHGNARPFQDTVAASTLLTAANLQALNAASSAHAHTRPYMDGNKGPTDGGDEKFWYCCSCGYGPWEVKFVSCHDCNNHWRCEECRVETRPSPK